MTGQPTHRSALALGLKFFDTPVAMSADFAGAFVSAVKAGSFQQPSASKFLGKQDYATRCRVTPDGIALVAISGVLVDRGNWLGDLGGWATSYEGLAEQCRRLAKDSAIKAVVLDIDSGGGALAGLWDLCAEIDRLKKAKKVYAVAANTAASAAFAIGCTAHEFYVTRSGRAGSVGAIVIHQSYARALDGAGIDTTIIAAGEHKADGNPFTQLSHGARAEYAAAIDQATREFVAHVARARKLSPEQIRGTEARTFTGKSAVDIGFADGVRSVEEVVEHIRSGKAAPASKPRPAPARRAPATDAAVLFGIGFAAALAHQRSRT